MAVKHFMKFVHILALLRNLLAEIQQTMTSKTAGASPCRRKATDTECISMIRRQYAIDIDEDRQLTGLSRWWQNPHPLADMRVILYTERCSVFHAAPSRYD
jgi:hypothetical protein